MSDFSSSRGLLYTPPPAPPEADETDEANRRTASNATGTETLEADD